ncbi:MAG: hypothetical protein R3F65_21820 [bacterium]
MKPPERVVDQPPAPPPSGNAAAEADFVRGVDAMKRGALNSTSA